MGDNWDFHPNFSTHYTTEAMADRNKACVQMKKLQQVGHPEPGNSHSMSRTKKSLIISSFIKLCSRTHTHTPWSGSARGFEHSRKF